jgi:hypothetical protein
MAMYAVIMVSAARQPTMIFGIFCLSPRFSIIGSSTSFSLRDSWGEDDDDKDSDACPPFCGVEDVFAIDLLLAEEDALESKG